MTKGIDGKSDVLIDSEGLDQLIKGLQKKGYDVVGPTLREHAIVYDTIASIKDLPQGVTDEQEKAHYRLKKRGDKAYFGYVVGPHSWKKYLHPPLVKLTSAERSSNGIKIVPNNEKPPRLAFLGVRGCELAAIKIQDHVFMGGPFVDKAYKQRRENSFLIAVNCVEAGGTCFCVSMNSGPRAKEGFDLSLTEVINGNEHHFLVTTGSKKGEEMLWNVDTKKVAAHHIKDAEEGIQNAIGQMGRSMDTKGIKRFLYDNFEHPQWDKVGQRCLTCANCTMVCPTCFCTTVEDTTDLTGQHADRWRKWDSCFTLDFSYVAGGHVRSTPKARYRQWMIHKLASWFDQFGSSGCVGCGRCITWCPVGIDITEEVSALRP